MTASTPAVGRPDEAAARAAEGPTPAEEVTTVADVMISNPKVSDTSTTAYDVRIMFEDDHLHAALITDDHGVLEAVVERSDLRSQLTDGPAAAFGTLQGRTVGAGTPLARARQLMLDSDRRRLAVVDARGRLLGLLCLKRTRAGFCTDQDVQARSEEAVATGPG